MTRSWTPAIILGLVAAWTITFAVLVMERKDDTVARASDGVMSDRIYHWKMVTTWPKNTPGVGVSAEKLATIIDEMSNGRLKIHVYGANELVPAMGVFEAVSSGSVEMGHAASYYWRGKAPAAGFFTSVPFGMNQTEQNAWLFYGGGMELWREVYAPFNLVPFAAGNTGVQMAGWFRNPLNSLADLRGLKMRISGIAGEVFAMTGGTAVNIPGGDVYYSLKSGVVDAADWIAPENDLAFGFHQIAKYYYYPGWQEPAPTLELMVNKPALEGLPKDLQAIVTYAARVINQDMFDSYTAHNARALQELKAKGVNVVPLPDDILAELRKMSFAAYDAQAAKDPQFKKIYESYFKFLDEVAPYQHISEQYYYKIREDFRLQDAEDKLQ
jgi:TRAP-type mannitol/chloroaromatic compound transport system substrate-binding protein